MANISIKYSLVLLFSIIVFSCSNEKNIKESNKDSDLIKMINEYRENAKNNSLSKEKKLIEVGNALYWSSKITDNWEKRKVQSEIGLIYYYMKEYDLFKKVNMETLSLSIDIGDSLGIARSYSNIGSYYNRENIRDSAYFSFSRAEEVYSKLDKYNKLDNDDVKFSYGAALYNLALSQKKFNDYVGSEASLINAIKVFENLNINKYLYLCYNNLGIISKDLGKYNQAIENYQIALEYAKKMKNGEFREIQALNNIGVVFKNQKKYDIAINYYKKALENKKILKSKAFTRAVILDNLTYVRFLAGERDNILESFLEPMKIRDSINDQLGLITNNIHIAEYYNSKGNDSIAKMYGLRAKKIADSIDTKVELLNSLLLLTKVSDEKEGLKYANQYIRLNDSLQNNERISRDKFARIQFETDEIVEQNQQISRENEILIIAILGLTALFLLGYIIFRQQQSNKELLFAQTQQESNEEIYRLFINQQIKLEEGRQLEQQRMSEELHDGVLGRLFGVRLSLDGINQRANDEFTDSRNKYIEELKAIEKEIRLISHDLGAETLPSDVAYIDAVENLIKDLCEVHKLEFEFNNDEDIDWEEIDDQKKVNFFRILQESMQNIFKHAHADSIKINFDYVEDKINLTILDDGIGFRENKVKKGIGLKNITSRVSQMSGVVKFLSEVNSGTTVSVSVPV
ncbi:tetratricopeptide repeat-containing sensor histidine kinase [Aquimarina algiphila]|uniref:tetratricopeptide repeat-containing sensor histidine kinase n=1 Tax=Aquimarina algiphila TaxID=2047982 RepID=UPI00248FD424|nr:sensor histidine kinase [Aquimarina algiphila]